MILPLAIFAQLATTCAPDVAPETLAALARTESGFDPFVIGDNTTRKAYHPPDQAEAIRTATSLLDAGHSIDLGIMQINSKNLNWLGLTVQTAFDPCENVRAGATVLISFSGYNTGSPTRGFKNGYVQKVVSKMRQLPVVPAAEAGESSQSDEQSPPPPPPVQPNWLAFEATESTSQKKPWLTTTSNGE